MKIKVLTPERSIALEIVIEASGHSIPEPTHVVEGEDGGILGAFSLAFAPVLMFWMAPGAPALASFRAHKTALQMIRAMGHKRVITPIQADSPFYRVIDKVGYTKLCECELFICDV